MSRKGLSFGEATEVADQSASGFESYSIASVLHGRGLDAESNCWVTA